MLVIAELGGHPSVFESRWGRPPKQAEVFDTAAAAVQVARAAAAVPVSPTQENFAAYARSPETVKL